MQIERGRINSLQHCKLIDRHIDMQPFKGSRRGHSLTAASNFLRAVSTVSPAWARSTCSGRRALARIRSSSHFGQLGTSHFLKGSAGVPPAVSRILRDTSSSGWSILLQAVVGASRSKPAEPRMDTQRMTRLIQIINSALIWSLIDRVSHRSNWDHTSKARRKPRPRPRRGD